MDDHAVLTLKNLTKQYPGVLALDRVSLDFAGGEVHALLGRKQVTLELLLGARHADPAFSTAANVQKVLDFLDQVIRT